MLQFKHILFSSTDYDIQIVYKYMQTHEGKMGQVTSSNNLEIPLPFNAFTIYL